MTDFYISVSIHTLHELEASSWFIFPIDKSTLVSIHTLHELEARYQGDIIKIRFFSFHSYASRIGSKNITIAPSGLIIVLQGFHSYASRIGSKRCERRCQWTVVQVSIHTLHELEARWDDFGLNMLTGRFHSYASRIGSKTSFAKLGCTRIVQRFFVGYWKA